MYVCVCVCVCVFICLCVCIYHLEIREERAVKEKGEKKKDDQTHR